MKRLAAGFLTLAVLAAIVWQRRPDSQPASQAGDSPADCIERMFAAAAQGDVPQYLACFTGAERQEIDRSLSRESQAPAAETLRLTMAELKGWAVVDPPADTNSLTSCWLVVEKVYAGRIDRQRMELRRGSAGWQIAQVDRSQPAQPAVPYGTPVFALDPTNPELGKPDQ